MRTYATICFEMRAGAECDWLFAYLQGHPRDVWDYEERVGEALHVHFRAHWTAADVVEAEVNRLEFKGVSLIEYRVGLRAGARDPRLLVEMLRRLKGVQEGVVRGKWIVHAWYKREGESKWTADSGNDGRLKRCTVRVEKRTARMEKLLRALLQTRRERGERGEGRVCVARGGEEGGEEQERGGEDGREREEQREAAAGCGGLAACW
jgi:hypothetical protein